MAFTRKSVAASFPVESLTRVGEVVMLCMGAKILDHVQSDNLQNLTLSKEATTTSGDLGKDALAMLDTEATMSS